MQRPERRPACQGRIARLGVRQRIRIDRKHGVQHRPGVIDGGDAI